MLHGKVQLKVLRVDENNSIYLTTKGSHSSSMICRIDNKQIQKKKKYMTNSKQYITLKFNLSELNPDPYTFNVNNYSCSALPYQRFSGDINKSKKQYKHEYKIQLPLSCLSKQFLSSSPLEEDK